MNSVHRTEMSCHGEQDLPPLAVPLRCSPDDGPRYRPPSLVLTDTERESGGACEVSSLPRYASRNKEVKAYQDANGVHVCRPESSARLDLTDAQNIIVTTKRLKVTIGSNSNTIIAALTRP